MSLAAVAFLLSTVAGLTVMALFVWRVFGGVRSLARTVSAAAARIDAAAANLPEAEARPYTDGIPRAKDPS